MHLLNFALLFTLLSFTLAAIFPVVPDSILIVLQNISKSLKFHGNLINSYKLLQLHDEEFSINDLVTLSKKELNEALLLKIARSFAFRNESFIREWYYNTLTGEFCDKNSDAISFSKLNNSFKFNIFLLGTIIKDEFGIEKKVFNGIYVHNSATQKTYSLEYDIDKTPLSNVAEFILAQAPKENNSEELNNSLVHLYQRNEQILQFFFQLTEKGSFPSNPFSFYQAIIGELLCNVSKDSLDSFPFLLFKYDVNEYFHSNWSYLSDYHSQLFSDPNHIILNDALYDCIMNGFKDYDNTIQEQFNGIFGLKNYWDAKANGLNAILQVCLNLQSLTERISRGYLEQKQEPLHGTLLDEFVKLIEFSQGKNALRTYDSTKIFDILSVKYGELHDIISGYSIKKIFFVILKELSEEISKFSKQGEVPSALVKSTVELSEYCFSTDSNVTYEDFEYIILSEEQFRQTPNSTITYFLENHDFRIASSLHANVLVQKPFNTVSTKKKEKLTSICSLPQILVVEIENGHSILSRVTLTVNLGQANSRYNLKATVSRNEQGKYITEIFDTKKLPVSVEDASISLIGVVSFDLFC